MKPSRDRERKRASRKPARKVSNREVVEKVTEFCQIVRQQNKELSALLTRQRQLLLAKLGCGQVQ